MLKSLGYDNRQLLAAACDHHQSEIDVEIEPKEDGYLDEDGRQIDALFGESIFHKNGQIEADWLEDQGVYAEFGDDFQEVINMEISKRVAEARLEGLFKEVEGD